MKNMWLSLLALSITVPLMSSAADRNSPRHPFPQAGKQEEYRPVRPRFAQEKQNEAVRRFYELWKKKYLLKSEKIPGAYKVSFNRRRETVSEAIGYGMLITVQMAGYDPRAREYFDGLDLFRRSHPSQANEAFMSWKVNERKGEKEHSATDGEIDMAMALLMAAEQWNEPKYREEARKILDAMLEVLVRKDGSLRLGDWQTKEVDRKEGTRTSDFEPVSFRVFYRVTGDARWKKVEATCFDIIEQLQKKYAPETGLVPDFAVRDGKGGWEPAPPGYLEGERDGWYGFNACRVPWRMGFAAMHDRNPRALKVVQRLMKWAVKAHRGPEEFKAGYRLDGKPVADFSQMVFTAPMGVAAEAAGNQEWTDGVFRLAAKTSDNYFSDSVNLICLMVMSGNYWVPDAPATVK